MACHAHGTGAGRLVDAGHHCFLRSDRLRISNTFEKSKTFDLNFGERDPEAPAPED